MDKKILIILALFLLILAGCEGIRFGATKEQAGAIAQDVHRGFKGVTIDFALNNPPPTAFTGNPLNIVVEVRNEGATVVRGATLYLSGYDSRLFDIVPEFKQLGDLEPRTQFDIFGGYEPVEFTTVRDVYLPPGTDRLDQTFLASICYKYRTEARIPVCIDPNPTSILEAEACRVVNPPVGGGQGGPVSVTAVREDAAPGQVNFLISIANLGDGTVVDQFSLGRCPSELRFSDVDTVKYSVFLSGQPGVCKPVLKSRLANKQGTIFCTFKLADSTSSAYKSILEVNLDYGYLSQRGRTVRVVNLNR